MLVATKGKSLFESGHSPRLLPEPPAACYAIGSLVTRVSYKMSWVNLHADDLVIMKGKDLWVNMKKAGSWYLGQHFMFSRSLPKTPVPCVSKASAQTSSSVTVVSVGSTRNAVVYLAFLSLRSERCTALARLVDDWSITGVTVGRKKYAVLLSFC